MDKENTTVYTKQNTNFGLFDGGLRNSVKSTSNNLDLETFVKENYNNQLITLSKENYATIQRPMLVIFHQFRDKYSELKTWLDLIYKIATEFSQELIKFAVADFEDLPIFYATWNDLDYFGFSADTPPYVYAVDSAGRQFQYEGNVTYEELLKFTQQLIDNKLWKSQQLPAPVDTSEYVETVVASNLYEIINKTDKDILITFYKNVPFDHFPFLEEAPCILKNDADNLAFFICDANENSIPLEFGIRGFPTSVLIPRYDKKKWLIFDHNDFYCSFWYKYVSFKQFLAANVTTELKLFDRLGNCKQLK